MSPRILVDITHPAHVHFFRPAIEIWRDRGIDVCIVARDKDVTLDLLECYQFPYHVLSKARRGLLGLAIEMLVHEWRLLKILRSWNPDVVLEVAGTFIVHAAFLARKPSLVFYDTEHAKLQNAITYPFATKIITPISYQGELGKKHVRYDGYQELAYLHPNYFQPDKAVINELGIVEGEKYSLVRFVSWDATHDIGHHGISLEFGRQLVEKLLGHGRIFISAEGELPSEFEKYRLDLPVHRIHDALAFADLYIGEGATMASEAAILGTPAIYINSLSLGYLEDQSENYELVFLSINGPEILQFIDQVLEDDELNDKWRRRREWLLADKIDVSSYLVEEVETFLTYRPNMAR